eukprot:TRINITY_DN315_c1_g1_i2.p1 TRINITY_DN315_c1_g1~~TRINITY_DN315_c1_g1_i2.p1  ORF type:complete len:591 (+),score=116.21 TRINITY_DN315_c1_g1_i2:144-1916(+)
MEESQVSMYSYPHYSGLWRHIDEHDLQGAADHPDLERCINDKQRGRTPLFLACLRRDHEMIHLLLQHGADPNIVCRGATTLYMCCIYGQPETVQLLLDHKADPNTVVTVHHTVPLHVAANKGIMELLDMLLAHGADTEIASPKYGTALHVAISKNHQRTARRLMDVGALPNAVNADGETPLHLAAYGGLLDCVRLLLQHGDLDATIKEHIDGNTPLHVATLWHREKIALALISAFPDLVHVRNTSERQSPMFYASDAIKRAIKNSMANKGLGFPDLVHSKVFSDITFIIGDRSIPAHRIIIFARCKFLWQLVTLSPSKTTVVIRDRDCDVTSFISILKYIYTDTLQMDPSNLGRLTTLAEKYQLGRLVKMALDKHTTIVVRVPESTFRQDLGSVIEDYYLADVAFMVDEEQREVLCHKCVLARHDYFRTMWTSGLKEATIPVVNLPDLPYEVFLAIQYYTYTWQLEPDLESGLLCLLLEAARWFMIDGLRLATENQLSKLICDEDASQLFEIADTYKAFFLREECFDHIATNFSKIKNHPHFVNILRDDLREEVLEFVARQEKSLEEPQAQTLTLVERVRSVPRRTVSLG